MQKVLEPAAKLAETGYAVHEIAAAEWNHGSHVDVAEDGNPVQTLTTNNWPLGFTLLHHPGRYSGVCPDFAIPWGTRI